MRTDGSSSTARMCALSAASVFSTAAAVSMSIAGRPWSRHASRQCTAGRSCVSVVTFGALMTSRPSGFQAPTRWANSCFRRRSAAKPSRARRRARRAVAGAPAYSFSPPTHALAEVGVGEPVRIAALHELPRGEAGPVQRLALEAGLREDLPNRRPHGPALPSTRRARRQAPKARISRWFLHGLWCFHGEPCVYPADFEAGYACCA